MAVNPPNMPFLTGIELATIAVGIGLSLAASILLRPKQKSPITDKEATTLASRGSYVPLILGRRRTGAVFGWAGDREARSEGGGGKKGGLSGGGGKAKAYYEAGWHQICIGPAVALHRIWQDGLEIHTGTITPLTHPSGSSVDLGKEGIFTIYWGESAQPVNTFLGDPTRVSVASAWPFVCYVEWNKKRLGISPRWPLIEYDIEVHPTVGTLGTSLPVIGVAPNDGVNPAHMIAQLMTSPYPHGLGLDGSAIDFQSLAELGTLMENEPLACSIVIRNGDECEKKIAEMLQDLGVMTPIVDGKMRFVAVRPPAETQPILSDDVLIPPRPEIESVLDERPVDQLIFSFEDRERNFRANSFAWDDDGQARFTDAKKGRKVDISSTVNFGAAARIADRRSQEELAGAAKMRVYANHQARSLFPGQSIIVHGVPQTWRITSVRPDPYSGKVDIECLLDFYGTLPAGFLPAPGATGAPDSEDPVPDRSFQPVIPPRRPTTEIGGGTGMRPLITARVRDSDQVIGADVWLSTDDVTYVRIGSENGTHVGGELVDAFDVGTNLLETGPVFTQIGPIIDLSVVQDLSPSPAEWRRGRQVLVIGEEVMFLRNISAAGGGQWRLEGIVRARLGTAQANHAVGATLYILDVQQINAMFDLAIVPGATIYVKTQPFTNRGAVELAEVDPVSIVVPIAPPFGPRNLRVARQGGLHGFYKAGDPVQVIWRHISTTFGRTGAGDQGFGEVVASPSPVMGSFKLELLDEMDVVKQTTTGITTPGLTIAALGITAAFGLYPTTFKIRVTEIVGPSISTPAVITVTKL